MIIIKYNREPSCGGSPPTRDWALRENVKKKRHSGVCIVGKCQKYFWVLCSECWVCYNCRIFDFAQPLLLKPQSRGSDYRNSWGFCGCCWCSQVLLHTMCTWWILIICKLSLKKHIKMYLTVYLVLFFFSAYLSPLLQIWCCGLGWLKAHVLDIQVRDFTNIKTNLEQMWTMTGWNHPQITVALFPAHTSNHILGA